MTKKLVRSAKENRDMVYEAMKTKGWNGKRETFSRKLYEETAYELNVFAYGKVVGTYEEDEKTNKSTKTAPKKTARGSSSSKKSKTFTLEDRVSALEKKMDMSEDLLKQILAKLS